MPWSNFLPQSLVTQTDNDAALITNSQREKHIASDPEIAALIFKALAAENPQLRRLFVIEGSLFHAFGEKIIDLHRIS